MKVLHLNAFDRAGGAAIAAMRLHHGLRDIGVESELFVQFHQGVEPHVGGPEGKMAKGAALARDTAELLPLRFYGKRRPSVFSAALLSIDPSRQIDHHRPEVVHLHWINAGMLSPGALRRFGRPIVWTMHDMWPFTGGCHYAGTCEGYVNECGRCPELGSGHTTDLSRWNLRRKLWHWRDIRLTAVAPSQWLADCARRSRLFCDRDVRVIRNGIDLDTWRPIDKPQARRLLNLPSGNLLLFSAAQGLGAMYKGGERLLESLHQLHRAGTRFTLTVMGGGRGDGLSRTEFPVHMLGHLQDEISRVLAYSAADLTVHSALQDNLPNSVAESLACGTPVVAFGTGGVTEMITDGDDGRLVSGNDMHGFAHALSSSLQDTVRLGDMAQAARRKARAMFDIKSSADAYRTLYEDLVDAV